jgi:hypothetical protein
LKDDDTSSMAAGIRNATKTDSEKYCAVGFVSEAEMS